MVEGTQAAAIKRTTSECSLPAGSVPAAWPAGAPARASSRNSPLMHTTVHPGGWVAGAQGKEGGGTVLGTRGRDQKPHTHTHTPLNPPTGASDSEEQLLAEDDRQESGVGGGPDEEDQMSSEAEDVRMGTRPGWTCSGARESCRWGGALHACGAPQ